jgi:hypothetical protein
MTGGVASTVSRRHAPDSQSRRRGIRRGLMTALFIFGAWAGAGQTRVAARAYMIRIDKEVGRIGLLKFAHICAIMPR